jgi:hypothetical protein
VSTFVAFADALLDPDRPVPAGVISPRRTPDARRFAVYRNNVFVSLVGALEKRFPVTRRLVGDAFFRGMARAFAAVERPGSPILSQYGDGLADFIAQFPPAAPLPYLPDMARLEAAWSDAYHAADAIPLALDALAGLPAEAVESLRLVPHPSARLIVSVLPVGSIWAAHQSETLGKVAHAEAETVLIVRPDAEVRVHVLPRADTEFAAALLAGQGLAEASGLAAPGCDPGAALVGLVSLGAFAGIAAEETQHVQ